MTSVHNDKLKKVFLKKEFYSLNIIGQFNLGFILATLNNGRDLFIFD
jgi:DNA mismatch repair protein PMS2